MITLRKLSMSTARAIIVATTLAAGNVQAFSFSTTPYSSACNPNGCTSSQSGITTINFNNGNAPSTGFATYTFSGTKYIPNELLGTLNPIIQGDATNYLKVGPSATVSSATITFNGKLNYFGLYWGSIDAENTIKFYQGSSILKTYTGTDLKTADSSLILGSSAKYVNFFATSSEYFDRVELSSTTPNLTTVAFENDNHAYRRAVPFNLSPGLGVLLLGAWGAVEQFKNKVQKRKTLGKYN